MYLKQCEVESRVEFFKGDIQEIIKSHTTIKKWAYILHDKDDTAPHYHIYLNFDKSGVDTKQIAEWFGLQESQVNRVRGRHTDMLLYLTHGNDSQKNKHQYSPTEVVANFDFETEIKNAQILGDFEHFSYAQQLEYVNSLSVSERVSAFSKLEKLWRLRCQWLSLQSDRQIDVIFICGKAGTGKTFYAKKILQSRNLDYYLSSSSNDPFDSYLGQKGVILDDLRDKTFEFDNLLKLLDNNTSSSVKSRFSNKVFNGEMIIITSSVPLRYWYIEYRNSRFDTLDQLYRRIGCYVEMTFDEIKVFSDGVDDKGNPQGLGRVFKNELVGIKKEDRKKTDFNSIFEKICENSSLDIQEVIPKQTIYNCFGYSRLMMQVESGTQDGEILERYYYISYKKARSKRFSSDCHSGFFTVKALRSKVGIDDLKEYATEKATFPELQAQNSYFVNDLIKGFLNEKED